MLVDLFFFDIVFIFCIYTISVFLSLFSFNFLSLVCFSLYPLLFTEPNTQINPRSQPPPGPFKFFKFPRTRTLQILTTRTKNFEFVFRYQNLCFFKSVEFQFLQPGLFKFFFKKPPLIPIQGSSFSFPHQKPNKTHQTRTHQIYKNTQNPKQNSQKNHQPAQTPSISPTVHSYTANLHHHLQIDPSASSPSTIPHQRHTARATSTPTKNLSPPTS